MWSYNYTYELYHYGVPGMKWGRRNRSKKASNKKQDRSNKKPASNKKLERTYKKRTKIIAAAAFIAGAAVAIDATRGFKATRAIAKYTAKGTVAVTKTCGKILSMQFKDLQQAAKQAYGRPA